MERPDILALFIQGFVTFWWAIPLIVLWFIVETSWFKGKLGEFFVARSFKKYLDPETYTILHDVTLPIQGGTTQIDHIVLSPFGIFVIETKNMSGWIFGSADNKKWTQTFHRSKFSFQNPIRQNFKHVKAVAAATSLPDSKLHSLVIFTGSAEFKTAMPANVTCRSGGVMYIRSFSEQLLTSEQVSKALEAIQAGRKEPGRATNREHIDQLQQNQGQRQCAKCGSPMALRTARKGPNAGVQFWGCSAFPKCRYTRPA